MRDARIPYINFNEPNLLLGRWSGQGANSAPTPLTSTNTNGGIAAGSQITSKGLTLARTGVGVYTLTPATAADGSQDAPGIPQCYSAWVNSSSNNKVAQVAAIANPFVTPYTMTIKVYQVANSVSVDVAVGEELNFEGWFARTSQP